MLDYKCNNCKRIISYKQWNVTERNLGQGMCKNCELNWKESQPDKYPLKLVEVERLQYEKWKKENILIEKLLKG